MAIERAALEQQADGISWFHRIDLGDGVVTRGVDDSRGKLQIVGLPPDLTGKSVLDIGAWDGFFSFEAERRGAQRVIAVDSYCWEGEGMLSKAGFELARRALGSHVEDRHCEVLDLSPERVGTFDVVLFLGVLYHMKHPLLALERVASVAREHLILETHVDLLDVHEPAMAYYPGGELNGDTTNWCGPNPPMVEAMLRTVGFTRIELKPWATPPGSRQGRLVAHAWR